jgi:hypothetical protein
MVRIGARGERMQSDHRSAVAAVAMAAVVAMAGARAVGGGSGPDPLATILAAHPEWFSGVLAKTGEHRVQILYTQIDRDARNRPRFRSFSHGLTDAYFYPASTVKLPAAVLALEKLDDLAIPGLTRDTPLRIEAGTPAQTAVERDPSKADGLPTIAHYVKKVFLVSDNDAFNRLYEFLGQREINERLWRRGFEDARILRRLEAGMDPEENRVTNPFVFFAGDRVLHRQPLARNPAEWRVTGGTSARAAASSATGAWSRPPSTSAARTTCASGRSRACSGVSSSRRPSRCGSGSA